MKNTSNEYDCFDNVSTALKVFKAHEHKAMIREEAYHGALARGFEQGDPLDDWLAAEKRIDNKIAYRIKLKIC